MSNDIQSKRTMITHFLTGTFLNTGNETEPLSRAAVSWFLERIILEILIKIIYELDTGGEAPHHHNILELFQKLNIEVRGNIEAIYDRARTQQEECFSNMAERPPLPSFQDVLKTNRHIVTTFKYEATVMPTPRGPEYPDSPNFAFSALFMNEMNGLIDSLEVSKN